MPGSRTANIIDSDMALFEESNHCLARSWDPPTFLEVWKSFSAICLARLQNNHRATSLIVRGIEPIPQVEGAVAMRLV